MTTKEAAKELNVSTARVRQLCEAGRIEGAEKQGRDWNIPSPVKVIPVTRCNQ